MDSTIGSINSISAQFAMKTLADARIGTPISITKSSGSQGLLQSGSEDFTMLVNDADKVETKAESAARIEELRAQKITSEFETVIVSQFVGKMLASSNSKMFGEGMQGELINTVLTEAISKQIAESGSLGLDKII